MSFGQSASSSSRPANFGQIVWNKKDESIPTPNIEFTKKVREVNPETGAEYELYQVSYLIDKKDRGQPEIKGYPIGISVFRRAGYNDNKAKNNEKNEWHLCVRMVDDLNDKTLPINVLHAVIKSDTGTVDMNTAKLLNLLHAYVGHLKAGEISPETPLMIGLYNSHPRDEVTGKLDLTKKFSNATLRLPSGYSEDGVALFDDAKNTIKAAELPPRPEKVMVNGVHFEANGVKAYDHANTRAWAEGCLGEIMEYYESLKAQQNQTESQPSAERLPDGSVDEEAVDLSDAVTEAEAQATRPRATA